MQATMNSNALAPSLRLQFARRDYMVRSEKRRRPHSQGSGTGSGRPPRRRRPRAGFFYKFLTVVLLLLLWPIGLILLCQRKLRWSGLMKVFIAVITLMACILLFGTALTVKIDNPTFTAVQTDVKEALSTAADSVVDFSVSLGERVQLSLDALDELNELYREQAYLQLADTIDQGVALAQSVKSDVGELIAGLTAQPEATDAPEETDVPDAETELPDAKETPAAEDEKPDDAESDKPEAESTPASDVTAAPTSVPAAEITVVAADEELPVYIPETTPDPETGAAVIGGILSRSGILEEGALPDPTPEPTPENLSFVMKPAGEAIVYFNIGSGRYYHMTNVCGSMKDADTHTFAETAKNIHKPCERCTPPDKALLEETYIVWLDENNTAHLTDECVNFEGQWNIVSAEDAIAAGYDGCASCASDRYLKALADGKEVTLMGGHAEAPEEDDAGEAADEAE